MKREIKSFVRDTFLVNGKGYNPEGLFAEVLAFEQKLSAFFSDFLGDPYLVEEVKEVRCLVEEVFHGTPYEIRFSDVCKTIEKLEQFV